jgi:hypothetical protein
MQLRNLTPSQRAALALELEKQLAAEAKKRLSEGGRRKGVETFPPRERSEARDKAAEMVDVNPHYVSDAIALMEAGQSCRVRLFSGLGAWHLLPCLG